MPGEKLAEREKTVKKGYDKIAKEYQADRYIFHNTEELKIFISILPKNATVLDVGCGAGVPGAKTLVESGFDVTGLDFSQGMLKLAKKNVPKAKFIKEDMATLGFRKDSFDGLVAFYSIIHVPREKHSSLFQSFHRVLKPNGVMLISVGSDEWEATEEYYGTKMFWSHYSPKRSLQLVKGAGFQIIFDKYILCGGEKHYWILARKKK
jgi:ubiquinone/menaquinone biosynthesis C-methylase UbiE